MISILLLSIISHWFVDEVDNGIARICNCDSNIYEIININNENIIEGWYLDDNFCIDSLLTKKMTMEILDIQKRLLERTIGE